MVRVSEEFFLGLGRRYIPRSLRSRIPMSLLRSGSSTLEMAQEMSETFGLPQEQFLGHVREGKEAYEAIETRITAELGVDYHDQYSGGPGIMPETELSILYGLIRTIAPSVVVETGVAQGSSSALILDALNRNNSGHLYSIDLPRYADETKFEYKDGDFPIEGFDAAVIPEGKDVGWLVQAEHTDRWTLRIGRSSEHLYDVLKDREVDVFIHDSEHSYQNILWEMSIAAPELASDGWLWVDDADWNDAFEDFVSGVRWPAMQLGRVGILKAGSEFDPATVEE